MKILPGGRKGAPTPGGLSGPPAGADKPFMGLRGFGDILPG